MNINSFVCLPEAMAGRTHKKAEIVYVVFGVLAECQS